MLSRKELILSSYRRLYRARQGLFRKDAKAMRESRLAVREQYLQHNQRQSVIPDEEFFGLLSMVDEAVDMLKHGVVQGNLNQKTGRYGKFAHSLSSVLTLQSWTTNPLTEVKLTADHVEKNSKDSGQPPLRVEPITPDTVRSLEKEQEPVKVDSSK